MLCASPCQASLARSSRKELFYNLRSTRYHLSFQPLDARVFQGYTTFLKQGFLRQQMESEDGGVSPVAWLRLLTQGAPTFLRLRKWSSAFLSVGAGTEYGEHLSGELRKQSLPRQVPTEPLSVMPLRACLPKGKRWLPSHFLPPRPRLRTKTPQ